ncbi:hypothetical protein Avbf_02346 [Armadillidium vulgare]|nr:hypothetical protein Avbf_02346 [Armadillidium vulgare]
MNIFIFCLPFGIGHCPRRANKCIHSQIFNHNSKQLKHKENGFYNEYDGKCQRYCCFTVTYSCSGLLLQQQQLDVEIVAVVAAAAVVAVDLEEH